MNREITIGFEKLMAMCIIAFGKWNGCQWEYMPHLPKPFTENLNFSYGRNADFLCLRVNDLAKVEVWFIDEDDNMFRCSLNEIKKNHLKLYICLFTHIYDMIENINS